MLKKLPKNKELNILQPPMKKEQILKWAAMLLYVTEITLTSFDIYPINIFIGLTGSFFWTWAAVVTTDTPLIWSSIIAVGVFGAGVANYLIHIIH